MTAGNDDFERAVLAEATSRSRRRAAAHRSFRAFRKRNFRIYFTGQVISTIGSWMQMLAQGWLVLELTDSGASLGLTMALQTLPILLIGAWGGVVADRVNNRRLLLMTSLGGIAQALALGTMQLTGHITVHWIYFFAMVLGVVTAFERPAMQAIIYELVGPDDLSSAVGMASTLNATGRLAGPALAGIVIATFGMTPVFFINAVTFAAVIISMLLLHGAEMLPRRMHAQRARLRDGLSYVWHEPTLRLTMAVMTVVGLCAFNFGVLVPSMIKFEFEAGPGALGIVQGIGGLGSVLAGLAVGSIRNPTPRTVGLAAVAFGLGIATVAVAPTVLLFGLLWFPLGVASAAFTTIDQTVLQRTSAPEYQGRVMSLFTIAWMGTTPIGGLFVGAVIDRWSPRVALGMGATVTFLAGLLALAATSPRMAARTRRAPVVVVPPDTVPATDISAGT